MKKNFNVLVFSLIAIVIVFDIFIVFFNHQKDQVDNEVKNKEFTACDFSCTKDMLDLIDSQSGITYHRKDNYSFIYFKETNEITAAKYSGIFSFKSLEELNAVENIPTLILDTEYDINVDNKQLTKIYDYYIFLHYGVDISNADYLEEYVHKIEDDGFTCERVCS